MLTLEVVHRFNHDADRVWRITGDFGGLKAWLPGVLDCRVSGEGAAADGGNAERAVDLMDGSVTRERLEVLDNAARHYEYSILEARGFDASTEYRGIFRVLPLDAEAADNAKCEVRWGVRLRLPEGLPEDKVAKVKARIENMYNLCLGNLARVLEQ